MARMVRQSLVKFDAPLCETIVDTPKPQGQEVLVTEGRANITIGRAEENDLVVKGNLISRLHARVETNRNKFMLIDQSTNGTFVLGKDGEEAFVRRDSMQLRGEGLIGLGKAPDSNSSQVIRYACEE